MNFKLTVWFTIIIISCLMSVNGFVGIWDFWIGGNDKHTYKMIFNNHAVESEIVKIAKKKYKEISACQKDDKGKKLCGFRRCYVACTRDIADELAEGMEKKEIPYSDGYILVFDNNNEWLLTWNIFDGKAKSK